MAGIFERLGNIISANVNALLDKAEDPGKMVDEYLRDARKDLAEVRKNTADVLAEEMRCKRNVSKLQEEAEELLSYAQKAVAAGNDGDATQFLTKKQEVMTKLADAKKTYEVARKNSLQLKTAHDKLVSDIRSLESRKENIKATSAVAKTQRKINEMSDMAAGSSSALEAFDRMADKAQSELDRAQAEAQLISEPDDDVEGLKGKYDSSTSPSVADELNALKAQHAAEGGN